MSDSVNFFKDFYSSWLNANMNIMKSSMGLASEAWKPETYEKFYGTWLENTGDMMEKIMRMPGFAGYSWEIFKSSTGFQKIFQEMVERYMKNMKLPTHDDIDELSQRINYLDNKIEELEKKISSYEITINQ